MVEACKAKSWEAVTQGDYELKKSLEIESRFHGCKDYCDYFIEAITALFVNIVSCGWYVWPETTDIIVKWEFTFSDGNKITEQKMRAIYEHVIAGNDVELDAEAFLALISYDQSLGGKEVQLVIRESSCFIDHTQFTFESRVNGKHFKSVERKVATKRADCARELYHAIGKDMASKEWKALYQSHLNQRSFSFKISDHPEAILSRMFVISYWMGGAKFKDQIIEMMKILSEDFFIKEGCLPKFSKLPYDEKGFLLKFENFSKSSEFNLKSTLEKLFPGFQIHLNEVGNKLTLKVQKNELFTS